MLKEKLSGKKFLLVLDDIWNESYNDWTILRSPFGVGTNIIVTTRLQNVSSNVVTVKDFHLDKLSHDDCLSIFTQHALGARDFSGHPELKEVGENIVRRCNGLPLAAKAIGGLLRTIRDQGAWEEIHESKLWDLPGGIIPALRLSYHHLPSHLKRCFAYCSLLPKDYEFKEEELILLWRAEGLLQQKAKNQIKNFGNQCFRDLVSRSFFQISSKDNSRYVMHDLMNDLAQLVAGEICIKVEEGKQQKISNRTRHFSYSGKKHDGVGKFEAFDQVNSLRTFLPLKFPGEYYLTSFVLFDLLPRLNYLRVLSLKGYCITELPDFFENLKHLRFLDFSYSLIKYLPDSLCTLYHLETLILRNCSQLEKLPSKIGDLVELHYLDISGSNSIKGMPLVVGNLTNLQRLSNFILGEGDGHHIRELRNLSKLNGDFCLSGLQNVKSQDAREAKLNEKSRIDRLTLNWSSLLYSYSSDEEDEELLEKAKLSHLHEIVIYWCSSLVSFEESARPTATNLGVFSIELCENFGAIPKCIVYNFSSLRELILNRCSADISFPEEEFPANLTVLEISNAPKIYRSLVEWGLDRLTSLQVLSIGGEGCSDAVSFPKEDMMLLPASLSRITIRDFENMEYMLSNAFQNLTSLQELSIYNCPKLTILPEKDMFLSLGSLWIHDCPLLKENCKTDEGREWPKIAHIPYININGIPQSNRV